MDPIFALFLLAVLALVVVVVWIYNRLVALRQRCKNAFSDVDVQLRQRHELVPKLVDLVKGYTKHEREIMESLTAARTSLSSPTSVDRMEGEKRLGTALSGLFAVAENYPHLKADAAFVEAQQEFSAIEQRLAASRRFFNAAVADFNTFVEQFPSNLVAGAFRFEKMVFFEVSETERKEMHRFPDVQF